MDGGEVGELEFENFNAAAAKITFKGRNVHLSLIHICNNVVYLKCCVIIVILDYVL